MAYLPKIAQLGRISTGSKTSPLISKGKFRTPGLQECARINGKGVQPLRPSSPGSVFVTHLQ